MHQTLLALPPEPHRKRKASSSCKLQLSRCCWRTPYQCVSLEFPVSLHVTPYYFMQIGGDDPAYRPRAHATRF